MHHLIFDTCVWVDLAVSEFSLVPKLAQLINKDKVTIVVPELVQTEWNDCKQTIIKQITDKITGAQRAAKELLSFSEEFPYRNESVTSIDPITLGQKISLERITAIEKILNSTNTIHVSISHNSKLLAVTHALQKKAPFRLKNSMADALIFFATIEWIEITKVKKPVFVTHNTKDFSDEKKCINDIGFKERLAPELQVLVNDSTLTFATIVGRVLNDIEAFIATEEEIEQGEAIVEHARIREDVIDKIISRETINSLFEVHRNWEKFGSGGALGQIVKAQKEWERISSGGALGQIAKAQKEWERISSGGALGQIGKAQKEWERISSGGALGQIAKAQKEWERISSGGALGQIAKAQKEWERISSGSALGQIAKAQQECEKFGLSSALSQISKNDAKNN